jgi:hypothetical protein
MPALNLKNMDVDALLVLRAQIDGQLATRRAMLDPSVTRLAVRRLPTACRPRRPAVAAPVRSDSGPERLLPNARASW